MRPSSGFALSFHVVPAEQTPRLMMRSPSLPPEASAAGTSAKAATIPMSMSLRMTFLSLGRSSCQRAGPARNWTSVLGLETGEVRAADVQGYRLRLTRDDGHGARV